MSDALRAEWTKLRALRSTKWSLFALLALTVILSWLIAASTHTDGCPMGDRCEDDLVAIALGGAYLGQMAAVALGVLVLGSEYSSGMIRTTFAATPGRHRVLLAKAAVAGGLVLVIGLLASGLAFLIASTVLDQNGYTAAHGYHVAAFGTELRAVTGTAVYLAAVALFSLGVTAVLRHTAAAISIVFAVLWVPLIVISMIPMDLGLKLGRFFPMLAGLAVQRSTNADDAIPIAPVVGLLVACAYAAAALGAGAWLLARRDA
ncbi:ABC transporter permease [Solirubrobacter soli]|uniref:ABC transporter permease n=1 Tax=Solirubrobacter soli TaxID=363832 RepID=UPI00041AA6CB|nr:ABC transporter permease [Solirubrobacter soli]